MKTKGFDKKQQNIELTNLPHNAHLTGKWEINLYGCWWEAINDKTLEHFWIIGEYPE